MGCGTPQSRGRRRCDLPVLAQFTIGEQVEFLIHGGICAVAEGIGSLREVHYEWEGDWYAMGGGVS